MITSYDLRPPEPMETLRSYLDCWRGSAGVSRDSFYRRVARSDKTVSAALEDDPDYPRHPSWIPVIAEITGIGEGVLAALGSPIGPWHLQPSARNLACLGCLDDFGTSSAQFRCKSWTYATTTMCHVHGLPLVEVPAVGWEWQDLTSAQRRANSQLMLNPSEARAALEKFWWSVVDTELANAIFRAEMSAWVAPAPVSGLSVALNYRYADSDVWEDLLVFLCTSWRRYPAISISANALPNSYRRSTTCFGDSILQPLATAPDLHYFERLSAPRRRSSVLVAYSILRDDDCYLSEQKAIFRKVVKNTSATAYIWLLGRSRKWFNAPWQTRIGTWFRMLSKEERPLVEGALRTQYRDHRKLWGI